MAGLGENINENKLKEVTKEKQIKEVVSPVKTEVENMYIETLKGLDKTQIASMLVKKFQNTDGTWKNNSEINRRDYGYQFLVQAALQLLDPTNTNLLGSTKLDADYGTATRNAVAKFQKENGIQIDGDAGTQTLAALSAKLKGEDVGDNIKNFYTNKVDALKTPRITKIDLPSNVTLEEDGSLNVLVGSENKILTPAKTPPMNTYTMQGNNGRFTINNKELYYAGDNKFLKYNATKKIREAAITTTYPRELAGIIGKFDKKITPQQKSETSSNSAEKLKEDNGKLSFTFNDVTVSLSRNDFISSGVNFLDITIDPKQKEKTIEEKVKNQILATIRKIDAEIAFGNTTENKLSYMFAINKDKFLSWEKKYTETYNNKNSSMNIKEKKDFSSQGVSAKPDVTFYDALGKNYSRSVLERIATGKENWKGFKSWVPSNPEKSTLGDYILEKSINTLLK